MRIDTEVKVGAGFCLAFLLLVGIGVWTYRTTRSLLDENGRVTHTYEVIIALNDTIASMTDAQTGSRGFAITGQERFLEPYNAALPRLSGGIGRVRRLTAENPNQQRRVAELQGRVERNLAVINEVIALRRRGETEAAFGVVRSGRGKAEMDVIRRIVRDMEEEEGRLLEERTARSKAAARNVIVAFSALTFSVFALLLYSYRLVGRDVARRKLKEKALREISLTDELTGLYNRRGFLTLAEQQARLARRSGKGLPLVFVDLDGLKRINDTYGHDEGSRAIRSAGEVLRMAFRESDVIARLGGDEFAVLVVGADETGGEFFRSRLTEVIRRHNEQADAPYELSMSVGIAHVGGALPVEDALSKADELMYEDKRRRRAETATMTRA
jgi:diguanylate cyclase (GGDEF)-like protein